MAYSVKWTQHAHDDVDAIVRYLVDVLKSPSAASNLLDALSEAERELGCTPELHAVGTEPVLARRGLCKRFIKSCVLLYSFDGSAICVYRILHMTQDYERILTREPV